MVVVVVDFVFEDVAAAAAVAEIRSNVVAVAATAAVDATRTVPTRNDGDFTNVVVK